MKKKRRFRIIIGIIAIIVMVLLFFYFRNIIVDIIRFAKANDQDSINHLLKDKGLIGAVYVSVIEALQMVIVFISAEFIQIAAGISYPWYIALLLCDFGIFLGASIIFFIVRVLKVDSSLFKSSTKRIEDIKKNSKKDNGTQVLMYVLFVLPLIPFGAICYYGSSTKISYRRYILTCITGVIPSILTSILMGNMIVWFSAKGVPLYALIIGIIIIALILFVIGMTILRKKFLKENCNTQNSIFYPIFMRFFSFLVKIKSKVTYDRSKIEDLEGPCIFVSNHQSFFDFAYLTKYIYPLRVGIICNRYYFRFKFAAYWFKRLGVIPKKLFTPDIETIKKTMNNIKNKDSVLIFPEGRLSVDGTNYHIVEGTGSLFKKLNVPVVILNINGAYLSNPKWRGKSFRSRVNVSTKHVIDVSSLNALSSKEIEDIVNENLSYNEYEYALNNNFNYKQKNKAKNLDRVLYICPNCHSEFTLKTNNNTIKCTNCNKEYHLNNRYSFDYFSDSIKNIHDWYLMQCNIERKRLENVFLEEKVDVEQKDCNNPKNDKTGYGVVTLTKEGLRFKGYVEKEIEFSIPIKSLKALPFGAGTEIDCYYEDFLYYMYFKENKNQCVKWALIIDELYKLEIENESK